MNCDIMKNKLEDIIIIFIMILMLFMVLLNKSLVFNSVLYSLDIWVKNLIPSCFPFFVISDILVNYHITNYIPKWIKKTLGNLFLVSESVITIFFLSILSGFPSNARIARMLYDNGEINAKEASHALIFTHFSNPLFVLSTVSVLFLHQEKYGLVILISHYLGNVILGLLGRDTSFEFQYDYTEKLEKSQSFSIVFIKAISRAIDTLFLIFGTLTCFYIFSSLLLNYFNFDAYAGAIIQGILEMTSGLKAISILNIPDIYKVVISSMFLSFGGLCVHLQVMSQLIDSDISYHPFLVARIFHAFISGFICYFIYSFLN